MDTSSPIDYETVSNLIKLYPEQVDDQLKNETFTQFLHENASRLLLDCWGIEANSSFSAQDELLVLINRMKDIKTCSLICNTKMNEQLVSIKDSKEQTSSPIMKVKYTHKMPSRAVQFTSIAAFDPLEIYEDIVVLEPSKPISFYPTPKCAVKYYEATISSLSKRHGGPTIGFALSSCTALPGMSLFSFGFSIDSFVVRHSFDSNIVNTVTKSSPVKVGDTFGVGIYLHHPQENNHGETENAITCFVTRNASIISQQHIEKVFIFDIHPSIALYNDNDGLCLNFFGGIDHPFKLDIRSEATWKILEPAPSTELSYVPHHEKSVDLDPLQVWTLAGNILETCVPKIAVISEKLSNLYQPMCTPNLIFQRYILSYLFAIEDKLEEQDKVSHCLRMANSESIGLSEVIEHGADQYSLFLAILLEQVSRKIVEDVVSYYTTEIDQTCPESLRKHYPIPIKLHSMMKALCINWNAPENPTAGLYLQLNILQSLVGGGSWLDILINCSIDLAAYERSRRLEFICEPGSLTNLPDRDLLNSYSRLLELLIPLTSSLLPWPKERKLSSSVFFPITLDDTAEIIRSTPPEVFAAIVWELFICTPLRPTSQAHRLSNTNYIIPTGNEEALKRGLLNVLDEREHLSSTPLSDGNQSYLELHTGHIENLLFQLSHSETVNMRDLWTLHSSHQVSGWMRYLPLPEDPPIPWNPKSRANAIFLCRWHYEALVWIFGPERSQIKRLQASIIRLSSDESLAKLKRKPSKPSETSIIQLSVLLVIFISIWLVSRNW